MFSTTLGLLTSFAYIIFVGLFLAVNPSLYRDGLVSLFTQRSQAQTRDILDRIGQQLYRWLGGRMLTMLITGLGTGLAMWFLGVPLAGSVGVLTALLTFIPNVGGAIALVFACMMALTQGATTVMWVFGLYLLLQLIESNVLPPLIQQRQTSIPPALLLAFQLLLGMLTGFLGLMVATPLLAAGMVIVKETWQSRESGVH
jgi:predicted PurR-regulated permease PerM